MLILIFGGENMPKLDSQGRLSLPPDLRREVCIRNHSLVALCYHFEKKSIYITDRIDTKGNCFVAIRKIDSKGRIGFPNECLKLLHAKKEDLLCVFLLEGKLYVRKA